MCKCKWADKCDKCFFKTTYSSIPFSPKKYIVIGDTAFYWFSRSSGVAQIVCAATKEGSTHFGAYQKVCLPGDQGTGFHFSGHSF